MSAWQLRHEGTTAVATVNSEAAVLAGLRDETWLPTDEVKGPADAEFRPIEAHPAFEEAAAELADPPPEPPDETTLDMNPLIDVCLVLLIFFILTITYESLRRAINLPSDTPDEKGTGAKVEYKDIKDRIFRVTLRMDGEKPVIKVEDKVVPLDQVQAEIKGVIDRSGRREMLFDVDGNVPWGVQTAVLDAAKANRISDILYRPKPRR